MRPNDKKGPILTLAPLEIQSTETDLRLSLLIEERKEMQLMSKFKLL